MQRSLAGGARKGVIGRTFPSNRFWPVRSQANLMRFPYASVGHHGGMQLGDGRTTGFYEQEREDGMDETGSCRQHHFAAEPRGTQQVRPVALTYRGGVFIE
jgi:hypothetical protein